MQRFIFISLSSFMLLTLSCNEDAVQAAKSSSQIVPMSSSSSDLIVKIDCVDDNPEEHYICTRESDPPEDDCSIECCQPAVEVCICSANNL